MSTPAPATPSPVRDLRDFLDLFADRCRTMQWLRPLAYVRALRIHQAAVDEQQKAIVADAYAAEQADIEAAQLIEVAKRDGLDASDLPTIERALKHIRNSAKRDHNIAEAARV